MAFYGPKSAGSTILWDCCSSDTSFAALSSASISQPTTETPNASRGSVLLGVPLEGRGVDRTSRLNVLTLRPILASMAKKRSPGPSTKSPPSRLGSAPSRRRTKLRRSRRPRLNSGSRPRSYTLCGDDASVAQATRGAAKWHNATGGHATASGMPAMFEPRQSSVVGTWRVGPAPFPARPRRRDCLAPLVAAASGYWSGARGEALRLSISRYVRNRTYALRFGLSRAVGEDRAPPASLPSHPATRARESGS